MSELTAEQASAVHAAERSIAVVAGAGTGKTRVLTARYLHLVLDRGVALPRVLALTFTEKAAREMKERIRAALVGAGRRDLARDAEFAPISTIHGFLARILRERALDAGLDPRFGVADEMTAQLLLEAALAETVDALDARGRAVLADLVSTEEALTGLYLAARATPLEMHELRPVDVDLPDLLARTASFLDACSGQAASGRTGEKLDGLAALRARLLAGEPEAAVEFCELVGGGVAAAQRDLFLEGKALRPEWQAMAHRDRAAEIGGAVRDLLVEFDAAYTRRKRADGLVDFADLERLGLRLLRSPAGDAVAADYDHLLVDEYQDTSRIQEALLERLAEQCERFGVGDEKQSIYRFRYADAEVFRALRGRAASYPLGGSFRSRPELVEFTNRTFRRLFENRDVEPQDLVAAREWPPRLSPCVEVITADAVSAPEGRRAEAAAVATRLRDLVEGEAHSFRYADCALLMRATTHLAVYERALADAGVPYVVVKGRGYYAAREVVELAHLLLLLSDPRDDFRAAVVMTSLFCGVPDRDLLVLPGGGPWPLRAGAAKRRPPAIPPERWERLRAFSERFARWRDWAGRLETGDLVERILEETRFADLHLLERDGRRRHANVRKVLRRARRTQADPAVFARELLEFREREWRESEAPIAGESDDAVKIMTVHAAKGLEFPVVAVADLTAGRPGVRGTVLHPDGEFGFRLWTADGDSVKPPGLDRLNAWNREQEENEALRLLYVALTRAEEHLLLSGSWYARCDRSILDPIVEAGEPGVHCTTAPSAVARRRRNGAVRAALRRAAPLPDSIERDNETADDVLARLAKRVERVPDSTPYVAAVADLVEFERCARRYRLGRMLGIEIDSETGDRPDADEHPRRLLGTVFHDLVAEIGPNAEADESMILAHFPEARKKDVDALRRWSAWLSRTPLAESLRGRRQEREMPFWARVGGLAVRGVVDLYAPELPLLLDYKTSREVKSAAEYEVQVAVYLAALQELGLPAPAAAHLVYVDAEEVVEVSAGGADELVARFVAAHRDGGAFEPEPGPACRFCDFRHACEAQGLDCPAP